MQAIFSPSIYASLLPNCSDVKLFKAIQASHPNLFTSQIESYETAHTCLTSPRLGIGQICSSTLHLEYSDYVSPIAYPIYSATGCEGIYYKSALLIHRKHQHLTSLHSVIQNIPKLRIAVNSFGSDSGWFLFLAALARYCQQQALPTLPTLSSILQTGSHNANLLALLKDEADLTCVDCISLALMQRYHPEVVKEVKIIGWTEKGLTPPFVTAKSHGVEVKQQLQSCLLETMSSMDEAVLRARQEMLLVGVIPNTGNLEAEYFTNINRHQALARKYFPHLMCQLKPGRLLRHHLTIKPEEGSSHREEEIAVWSQGRLEDVHWPRADFCFQQYLRSFFLTFCYDRIVDYLLLLPVEEAEAAAAEETRQWTVAAVKEAIRSLVGKESWAALPYGGSAKVIVCSWQGVVHLLALSPPSPLSPPPSPAAATVIRETERMWTVSSSVVAEDYQTRLFALITELYETEVKHTLLTSEEQQTKTVCFSGFMGCASKEVQDYFDSPPPHNNNSHPSTTSPSLMSELWAIDLALSEKLLESGESLGLYVYISAPRHNDRYDWGNLVIGRDEAAIVKWRDSISHSAARKYIAPRSYEHIRIHRGWLREGLVGQQTVQLQQTTFLTPQEVIPTERDHSNSSSNHNNTSNVADKEAYDHLFQQHSHHHQSCSSSNPPILTELNRLFQTQSHILSATTTGNTSSFAGYDVEKTRYYFKRRLLHWSRAEVEQAVNKAGAGSEEEEEEEELIPHVKGSVKSSFYADLREMDLIF